MFKRTFKVVYRPVKNNFILLPENYFKVVSTYVSFVKQKIKLEFNLLKEKVTIIIKLKLYVKDNKQLNV